MRSRRLSASAASSSNGRSPTGSSSSNSGMEISTSFIGAGRSNNCLRTCSCCCCFLIFNGIGMLSISSSPSPWFKWRPSRRAPLELPTTDDAPGVAPGVACDDTPGVCATPRSAPRPGVAPGVAPGVPPGVAPGVAPGVMPDRACSAYKFGVIAPIFGVGNAPDQSVSCITGFASPWSGVCILFRAMASCASMRTVFCCRGVRNGVVPGVSP
mmetsp:Transcript_9737/g.25524  ORF Transcript_9737/g.25524 Transcript_9737/m.25524 type:complete len:212 (+) Transcript_9737:1058-1693(+)